MKKVLFIAAAIALVLCIAVPALAGGGVQLSKAPRAAADGKAMNFELNGDVLRVLSTAGALKVHVNVGSAGVRPFIGRALSMRVGGNAMLLSVDEGIAHAIKLRQVKPGQRVHIAGRIDRSTPWAPVYVATTVQVRHYTPTAQLDEFAGGGLVTAVDASGVHFTVKSASRALWASIGTDVAVSVPPTATLFKWVDGAKVTIALSDIAVGARIWTRGTIDRATGTPLYSADVLVLRQAAATATN